MISREAIVTQIPRLRRYARALTGDQARADDLVQDTLERALSKWLLWRSGSDLRAWLFALMHNLWVNQAKKSPTLEYQSDEQLEALPETATRGEQFDGLEVRDLDRALGQLPLEQREVLLLVGLEELAYVDVARVLNVPVGTVMSRLSRGRERLRGILAVQAPPAHLKVIK